MRGKGISILLFLYSVVLLSAINSHATGLVCIDPGHGGPDASMYGPNGDNRGSHGPNLNLSEQWVNLDVAYSLAVHFDNEGISCQMTREEEQEYVSLQRRASLANVWNATHFISIHHNGNGPTTQGTEVYWSDREVEIDGVWRDTDSLLAKKVLLRLLEAWD